MQRRYGAVKANCSLHSDSTALSSLLGSTENEPVNITSRRMLVDYTQCRRDGTASSKSSNAKRSTEYPRNTALKMGLPTCFAFEASLTNRTSGDDKKDLSGAATKKAERISFYLKVQPKSQRKPTRTSSLDRAVSRRDWLQQMASSRNLDGSTQSLGARSTRSSGDTVPSERSASYQQQRMATYTLYISKVHTISNANHQLPAGMAPPRGRSVPPRIIVA
jgi:hypothetical protein